MQRKEYSLLWHPSLLKFNSYMTAKTDVHIHTSWMRCFLCTKLFNIWSGEIRLFPAERLSKEWPPISTHGLPEIPLTFIQGSGYPWWGLRDGWTWRTAGRRGLRGPAGVFWTRYWWYKCVLLRKCIKLHTSNSCRAFPLYLRYTYVIFILKKWTLGQ